MTVNRRLQAGSGAGSHGPSLRPMFANVRFQTPRRAGPPLRSPVWGVRGAGTGPPQPAGPLRSPVWGVRGAGTGPPQPAGPLGRSGRPRESEGGRSTWQLAANNTWDVR